MSAYSSSTTNFSETPRIVSGLSAPFRLMTAPLTNLICMLFTWLDSITGLPSSSNVSHIMSLACPCVGATYHTLPLSACNASTMSIHAANLDLPVLRPAATTLNRLWSFHTCCCQGNNLMSRFIIYVFCIYGLFSLYLGIGYTRDVNCDTCLTGSTVLFKIRQRQQSIGTHLQHRSLILISRI